MNNFTHGRAEVITAELEELIKSDKYQDKKVFIDSLRKLSVVTRTIKHSPRLKFVNELITELKNTLSFEEIDKDSYLMIFKDTLMYSKHNEFKNHEVTISDLTLALNLSKEIFDTIADAILKDIMSELALEFKKRGIVSIYRDTDYSLEVDDV